MNIMIDEQEHEYLQQLVTQRYTIGSHLYGTAHANSDLDYLCLYPATELELRSPLPNAHPFLYKDKVTNIDWNYSSDLQFSRNLLSGDSTVNADVVLFTDREKEKLSWCRTYKVIRAYLGYAKRDLKQANKAKKMAHAARELYCAELLLDNRLPTLDGLRAACLKQQSATELQEKEQGLRAQANSLYDAGLLHNYYITKEDNSLWHKMLQANNTKAFRY